MAATSSLSRAMLAFVITEDFNACTGMPRKVVFPMGPATLAKQ